MNRTYTASRISEGNQLFPPTIILTDEGVNLRLPALFHNNTVFIPYNAIGSVDTHTPLVGFSTITFNAFGKQYVCSGFYRKDVLEMRDIISRTR